MRRIVFGLLAGLLSAVGLHALTPARPHEVRRFAIDAEDGGPLREVAMHFDPAAADVVMPTYRQLIGALDRQTRVRVAVPDAAAGDALRRGLGPLASRIQIIPIGRPITTWARDRYWMSRDGGRRTLLVPRPAPTPSVRRTADELVPFALARTSGALVRRLPLIFDGGDLAVGGGRLFVTPTLAARNPGTPLASPRRLQRWLEETFGQPVILIGQRPQDVPPHHIGMMLAPIGNTVMVGDVDLGMRLAHESGAPVQPTQDQASLQRFRHFVQELEAHRELRVVRTPLVPLEDPLTYVTYTNVLMEHRAGRLHVYVPQFGLAALDRAGRESWEAQGALVHPIDVSHVYPHRGTVHCLVHVLSRG